MGEIAQKIEEILTDSFAPQHLMVLDESDSHAGHAGAREGGESHFAVGMVSDIFDGQPRLMRQRVVLRALEPLMSGDNAPIHALRFIALKSPVEKNN